MASSAPEHGHIVAIRHQGEVIAYQCRFDGGGPGKSIYFSANKFGSIEKARRAALKALKDQGIKPRPRGGSPVGRVTSRSLTQVAGIRFSWTRTAAGPVMRVIATWTDKQGRNRHTSYSVERHGLKRALEQAVEARTSCGAPAPAFAPLLRRLRDAHQAGLPAKAVEASAAKTRATAKPAPQSAPKTAPKTAPQPAAKAPARTAGKPTAKAAEKVAGKLAGKLADTAAAKPALKAAAPAPKKAATSKAATPAPKAGAKSATQAAAAPGRRKARD